MGNNRFDKSDQTTHATLSTTPLYIQLHIQLRDAMVERIQAFVWKPDRLLPNEVALANEFGVSIGTVRKAMDDLSARGLVIRCQGRGTFVADTRKAASASLLTQIRHQDGSPIVWDPPHTAVTVGPASHDEVARFGWLGSSAPLVRFEWLTGAQGRRMVLQMTSLPSDVAEIDLKHAKHFSGLDEVLNRARILLDRTEVAMSVTLAPLGLAARLKVPSGTYLQRLQRRHIDMRGKPIAISDDWLALNGELYIHTQHRGQS